MPQCRNEYVSMYLVLSHFRYHSLALHWNDRFWSNHWIDIRHSNQTQRTFTNRNEIYLYVTNAQCVGKIEEKTPLCWSKKKKTTKWTWECDCVDEMDSIKSGLKRFSVRLTDRLFGVWWVTSNTIDYWQ